MEGHSPLNRTFREPSPHNEVSLRALFKGYILKIETTRTLSDTRRTESRTRSVRSTSVEWCSCERCQSAHPTKQIWTQHTYEGNVILKPITGKAWMISIHISNLGRRSSMSYKTGLQWVLAGCGRKWRYPRRHCPLQGVSLGSKAAIMVFVPWVPIIMSVAAPVA